MQAMCHRSINASVIVVVIYCRSLGEPQKIKSFVSNESNVSFCNKINNVIGLVFSS